MKISILTPVHLHSDERSYLFSRCLKSVSSQYYDQKDIEHIIINDGSTYPFKLIANSSQKVLNQPHLERINALNLGFKAVTGDVILLLDSDDELEPHALSRIKAMFEENPDYKMINFGCTFIHQTGNQTQRSSFKPKELEIGHEIFGPGNIVNGTFAFKKEIYDDLGAFMPMHVNEIDCTTLNYGGVRRLSASSPWDFSAYYQLKFPEIQQYFMVKHPDHPHDIVRELGNPWGQDYILFYMYTRKYHSKPFDEYLLRVHLR